MTAFETLCRSDAPATRTLLEMDVFFPGTPSGAGIIPFLAEPFLALPAGEEFVVSEKTERFGDGEFFTRPDDSPANTRYKFAQLSPPGITRGLPLGPLAGRRLTFAVGEASLAAQSAGLDSAMAAAGIDGRPVLVRVGAPDWALADFGLVFSGAGQVWWRDGARLRLRLRDNSYKLARTLQTSFYAGSGGAEGGADLANLPRPLCFGLRRNVPAVLVNAAAQIYQVHSRSIQSVLDVFEGGAARPASGDDYANYAALAGATIPSGEYATCLAGGYFRLEAQPTGRITADIEGDDVGGYVNTAAEIAARLLQDFGDADPAEIDAAALAAFAAAEPGAVGWWRGPEAIDIDAAMDQIAGLVLGWWGCRRSGLYTMGALRGPVAGDADYTISEAAGDIISITALEPAPENWPPPWRIGVGYDPVEIVQPGDGLIGSATAARKQLVAQARRYAVAADPSIPGRYRQAQNWSELPAGYSNQADAAAKAAALLAAFGPGQRLYEVTMPVRRAWLLDLGQGGPITAPSVGLIARASRVLGIQEDAARNLARVTLWVAP